MSTCISRHGEYSSHTLDEDYVCTLCQVLDEEALTAEVRQLRARNAELEAQRAAVLSECDRVDWISSCQVRELLGDDCDCATRTEPDQEGDRNPPDWPELNKQRGERVND